jgi:branched-chain amino acid transport system substrate-binding protein
MIPIASALSDPTIYEDPAEMAVGEINAHGGIDGHPIVIKDYDSDFTTSAAITAMQQAIADHVSAVIGLPVADQVLAVRSLLDRAQIPLLYLGGGYAAAYTPNSKTGSSEWAFRVGPPSELTVKAGAEYAAQVLHRPNIGLMLRDDESQQTNTAAAQQGAAATGGKITVSRTIPLNSTDVTTEILAEKSVNAIIVTDYQPGIVATMKAIQQENLNIPTIAGQTGMQVYLQKLAPQLIKNMYSAAPCNMADPATSRAKAWVTEFVAKYHFMPDPNSSTTYDAFYLLQAAYNAAHGQSGAPLLTAFEHLNYPDGVCMSYKTDAQHFMGGTEVMISFASGTPKTVKTYDFQG